MLAVSRILLVQLLTDPVHQLTEFLHQQPEFFKHFTRCNSQNDLIYSSNTTSSKFYTTLIYFSAELLETHCPYSFRNNICSNTVMGNEKWLFKAALKCRLWYYRLWNSCGRSPDYLQGASKKATETDLRVLLSPAVFFFACAMLFIWHSLFRLIWVSLIEPLQCLSLNWPYFLLLEKQTLLRSNPQGI